MKHIITQNMKPRGYDASYHRSSGSLKHYLEHLSFT